MGIFKKHHGHVHGDTTPPSGTPPLEHDYAELNTQPVADAKGNVGGAQVFVDAGTPDGTEAIGSAAQTRAHNGQPGATLLGPGGEPVSGLPVGTREIDTILTSGAKGLGPEGTATLRSLQASAGLEGHEAQAVVAPAKGIAPEAVLTAEPPQRRNSLLHRKAADASQGEDVSLTNTVLNAISQVLPEHVLGVNLSPLSMSRDATKDQVNLLGATDTHSIVNGGDVKDARDGLPTHLASGAPPAGPAGEPGIVAKPIMPEGLLKIEKASEEDNQKFHRLFEIVPEDDSLIHEYACALQRQILIQGKLYLSQHHIAFHANIFGVQTNLIVPLSEIVTIEKRNTALVIPNAIEIATLHARHTFASLLHRDDAFDLIVKVWRFTHPETGVPPVDTKKVTILDDHATEDAASIHSVETAHDNHKAMSTAPSMLDAASFVSVETTDTQGQKIHKKRKLPKILANKLSLKGHHHGHEDEHAAEDEQGDEGGDGEASGHPPTEADEPTFKEVALDAKFNAAPEKIFHLMFSSGFMLKFFSESQKLTEIQVGDWKPDVDKADAKRDLSYIKPLNASMGPKSTKCLITDTNEHVDPDKYFSTLTITKTPDVPVGSTFEVRTRTTITHAGGGKSRVHVTTEVYWHSPQRFLKGIIEKSAVQGQISYHDDLRDEMRKHIKAHSEEFGGVGGADDEAEDHTAEQSADSQAKAAGGLLSSLGLPPTLSPLILLVAVLLLTNIITFAALRRSRATKGISGISADIDYVQRSVADLEKAMEALRTRAARLATV